MKETCAYCGDEVLADGLRENDRAFCCEECLDAFNEDSLDYLDQTLEDDY